MILFINGSQILWDSRFLDQAFLRSGLQCIGATDEAYFEEVARATPWLIEYFREIHVRPLDEDATFNVLQARKAALEKFHGVIYSEATLKTAVRSSTNNVLRGSLPQTALELLDAAGTMVKLRRVRSASEIAETQKRIRLIVDRQEKAIRDHEFEKAKSYADEAGKEKENLRVLQEMHGGDAASFEEVTPDDIEKVISRWSAYPYSR